MELARIEGREKLELDRQKLKRFQKEIEETFDRNLDVRLIEFIDQFNLEIDDYSTYWIRKYNEYLKER